MQPSFLFNVWTLSSPQKEPPHASAVKTRPSHRSGTLPGPWRPLTSLLSPRTRLWDHTTCGPVCLTSSTQPVSSVLGHVSVLHSFWRSTLIPMYGENLHGPVDGHSGGFHFFAITDNAAYKHVGTSFDMDLYLLGLYLLVELLGHIRTLYLTLWGAAELFSKAATPFSMVVHILDINLRDVELCSSEVIDSHQAHLVCQVLYQALVPFLI